MFISSLLLFAATPAAASDAMPASAQVMKMTQNTESNSLETQMSTVIERKVADQGVVSTPAAARKKNKILTILGVIGAVLGASIGI